MASPLVAWLEQHVLGLAIPFIKISLTILFSLGILRLLEFTLKRFRAFVDDHDPTHRSDAEKRADTLATILNSSGRIVVWGVAAVISLEYLGMNITPILTGAGIVGIVVGLGAQNLVKDIIVGFFILFENQYGVGDIIRIDTLMGTVEKMDLRATILRAQDGSVHIIPNGTISRVTVLTRTWSRALVDVRVTYDEDVDQAMGLLKQVGTQLKQETPWDMLLLEDFQVLGVEDLAEQGVIIRTAVKTLPGKQWEVMRELRRRIKRTLDKAGVAIAFSNTFVPIPASSPVQSQASTEPEESS